MFNGCSSLNYIKYLLSTGDPGNSWVQNVSNSGVFIKQEGVTWTTGTGGIPSG